MNLTTGTHMSTLTSVLALTSTATLAAAPSAAQAVAPQTANANDPQVKFAPISAFVAGPNARKVFEGIRELAVSIYNHGLIAPLIVRERGERLETGAGGRRLKALQLLTEGFEFEVRAAEGDQPALTVFMQLPTDHPVPYQVRELDDTQMVELAIIENGNRSDLTVMEKTDVFMVWHQNGVSKEEIAMKGACSVGTVDSYLRLGYGLGRDGRKLYAEGRINFKKALILASVTGSMKQTLIRAAKDGMTERDMHSLIRVSAFTPECALFDVQASGLALTAPLFGSDIPVRFEDQRAAMSLQMDTAQAQAQAHTEATGEWAEVVPVDHQDGVLPTTYQHHGQTAPGKVWTVSTVTGKVTLFEGVRRVSAEREAKRKPAGRAAPSSAPLPAPSGAVTGTVTSAPDQTPSVDTPTAPAAPVAPAPSRIEAQADREARQQATLEGLFNNPRVALAHTVVMLFEAPRADRTVPAVQKYAANMAKDRPELFRLLSPGVLALAVSRTDALGILTRFSDAALAELLAYLTSSPLKDEAYAEALLSAASAD